MVFLCPNRARRHTFGGEIQLEKAMVSRTHPGGPGRLFSFDGIWNEANPINLRWPGRRKVLEEDNLNLVTKWVFLFCYTLFLDRQFLPGLSNFRPLIQGQLFYGHSTSPYKLSRLNCEYKYLQPLPSQYIYPKYIFTCLDSEIKPKGDESIDLNDVGELVRHKSMAMTLRYAHLSLKHKRKVVNVLDRVMAEKSMSQNPPQRAKVVSLKP